MLKKILKRAIPYAVAIAVGLILWWLMTPYAKTHRMDPTLIGGEALFPLLAILCIAFFKSFKESRLAAKYEEENNRKDP